MKPLLLTHPDCMLHEMPGHPERPERLASVMERLRQSGLIQDMDEQLADEVSLDHLQAVHPESYISEIMAAEPASGLHKLDPDTYMSPGSVRTVRLAAGAVVSATQQVLSGAHQRAFCAIRPPGHHAELAEALGFCLFNSVAIAAELALQDPAINRVAICDFDVHHCNGTVDIFKDRPEVLVCSSFQDHFYPHRYLDFCNAHIINTPLAQGTASREFRLAIERDWIPAIEKHKPDLMFVSAGFDAHEEDPLAQVCLQDDDFRWITQLLLALANQYCGGRLISTMEGGYDLAALARSAEQHVTELIKHPNTG